MFEYIKSHKKAIAITAATVIIGGIALVIGARYLRNPVPELPALPEVDLPPVSLPE